MLYQHGRLSIGSDSGYCGPLLLLPPPLLVQCKFYNVLQGLG